MSLWSVTGPIVSLSGEVPLDPERGQLGVRLPESVEHHRVCRDVLPGEAADPLRSKEPLDPGAEREIGDGGWLTGTNCCEVGPYPLGDRRVPGGDLQVSRSLPCIWSGHVGPPPYTGYCVQGIQSMSGGWVVGLAGGQNRCTGMLPARCCGMITAAVLGGELAVPCTRNPLQRDRIPARGLSLEGPARASGEEGRIPRNGILPTPPGPEGSNGT